MDTPSPTRIAGACHKAQTVADNPDSRQTTLRRFRSPISHSTRPVALDTPDRALRPPRPDNMTTGIRQPDPAARQPEVFHVEH